MSPPKDHPALTLSVLDGHYLVQQLNHGSSELSSILKIITQEQYQGGLLSIARTDEEMSIVRRADFQTEIAGEQLWKCIKVKGPMEFGLTGVLYALTKPLKDANIAIFAMSTWNTDYLLVGDVDIGASVSALKADGWKFEN